MNVSRILYNVSIYRMNYEYVRSKSNIVMIVYYDGRAYIYEMTEE
jgi:hypothetical protein